MDRLFTTLWRYDVDGREVEVENRWTLFGCTRERLFLDGELVAQNRGWMSETGDLEARLAGAHGPKTVRARLTGGRWRVRCDLEVADGVSPPPPAKDPEMGPWGPRRG